MNQKPTTFARVTMPHGHFTVPAVVAERAKMRVLKQPAVDDQGRPLPSKPRTSPGAATPTTESGTAPDDNTSEESE